MKTQLLQTNRGSFEYSGCNNKVTVAQLKAYLKFNGIEFGNKILKKDLCHVVDNLLKHIQKVKSVTQQGVPPDRLRIMINFLVAQTKQQQQKRLRSQTKKTTTKPKPKLKKTIVKRKKVIKKKIVKRRKVTVIKKKK